MADSAYKSIWHRTVGSTAIFISFLIGFEALVNIANLNQNQIYVEISGFIYLILLFWLYFLFDLHFRDREHFTAQTLLHAFGRRFKHFANWEHLRYFQNYLILPGVLYWGAVILIAINFNHLKLQHFVAVSSALALALSYSMFKEVFNDKAASINNTHFIVLIYVKLFASWLAYSAALGIVWYYCFPTWFFYAVVFLVALMLLYQSLFQFCVLSGQHFLIVLGIAAAVTISSFFVYKYWNVNYFSAGLFMTAIYNFGWSLFYHKIKETLSLQVFMEQLAILALILIMVFGVTDFKAKIDRCVF